MHDCATEKRDYKGFGMGFGATDCCDVVAARHLHALSSQPHFYSCQDARPVIYGTAVWVRTPRKS